MPDTLLTIGTVREVQDYNENWLAVLLLDPSWYYPQDGRLVQITRGEESVGTAICRGSELVGHELAILLAREGAPDIHRLDQLHLLVCARAA